MSDSIYPPEGQPPQDCGRVVIPPSDPTDEQRGWAVVPDGECQDCGSALSATFANEILLSLLTPGGGRFDLRAHLCSPCAHITFNRLSDAIRRGSP